METLYSMVGESTLAVERARYATKKMSTAASRTKGPTSAELSKL